MRFNTLQVRFKPLKWRSKIENSRFQKRVLAKAKCFLNLPFRKLGSRMDGLIFVLGVSVKFHQSCDYFNVYTVIAAWRRASSDLIRTCLDAGKAGRDAAAPTSMQSRVISGGNFCAPRKFRNFSIRNRSKSSSPRGAAVPQTLCGPVWMLARPGAMRQHRFRCNRA